jgi:hypothetical protein
MQKLLSFLCVVAACVSVASAQTGTVTITGEVVDVVSYMVSGVKADSPQNIEIIQNSARGGNPLGILDAATGRLYVVTMKQSNTAANQNLLPWIGMKISAKGEVYSKGSARVLVLTTVGKALR